MIRLTYEKTLQNVHQAILSTPGISNVGLAKVIHRSPDSVALYTRALVALGHVSRVRIGNSNVWLEKSAAAEFAKKYQLRMMERLPMPAAVAAAIAQRALIKRARQQVAKDSEFDSFCDTDPLHRTVCAKTAPRINTTAANSIWQFADRA